jgi:hypothetical protein
MSVFRSGLPASPIPRSAAAVETYPADDALPWLVMLVGGLLLVGAVLLLGGAVGDLLFRGHALHVLPAYASQVMPKPAQFGRYALAILVTLATAGVILATPRADFAAHRGLRRLAPPIVLCAQLVALAVAVWAWRGQNEGINHSTPVRFDSDDLLVALVIAAALMVAGRKGWLGWIGSMSGRQHRGVWVSIAVIVTALWLAPALYRSLNLAHAMTAVWYPLQFTFDDFISVLDGRTPLVNYDTQYGSLLPFVTEPAIKVFGASVGTFTTLMWLLSLLSFMCVERSLALVARDERVALLLYVPLLAVSLFVLRHAGDERYYMANYYEVMPLRYVGPYVLFWCSVRHLHGTRPRRPFVLFTLAGLVAINNAEFGIPALGGCALALASAQLTPQAGSLARLRRLAGELAVGVVLATVAVVLFILLRSGSLPEISRLTRYEQIYAVTGFNLVPTPDSGLHIVMFMTFAATLILGALRTRSMHPDRLLTGALIFSGTFGMGAGSYYVGRSLPEVLASLFSAWGLAVALLCLVALQTLRDPSGWRRIWPLRALTIAAALVLLGLCVTTVTQFPAPWTQWRRLTADSHVLPFNTAPASRFVRAASHPGESVALFVALGHLIARDAGVVDVSPYSHPDGIVTYEQLDEVLSSLRTAKGNTIFTGAILPEVSTVLTEHGYHIIARDGPSALSEWRASPAPEASKT